MIRLIGPAACLPIMASPASGTHLPCALHPCRRRGAFMCRWAAAEFLGKTFFDTRRGFWIRNSIRANTDERKISMLLSNVSTWSHIASWIRCDPQSQMLEYSDVVAYRFSAGPQIHLLLSVGLALDFELWLQIQYLTTYGKHDDLLPMNALCHSRSRLVHANRTRVQRGNDCISRRL